VTAQTTPLIVRGVVWARDCTNPEYNCTSVRANAKSHALSEPWGVAIFTVWRKMVWERWSGTNKEELESDVGCQLDRGSFHLFKSHTRPS